MVGLWGVRMGMLVSSVWYVLTVMTKFDLDTNVLNSKQVSSVPHDSFMPGFLIACWAGVSFWEAGIKDADSNVLIRGTCFSAVQWKCTCMTCGINGRNIDDEGCRSSELRGSGHGSPTFGMAMYMYKAQSDAAHYYTKNSGAIQGKVVTRWYSAHPRPL